MPKQELLHECNEGVIYLAPWGGGGGGDGKRHTKEINESMYWQIMLLQSIMECSTGALQIYVPDLGKDMCYGMNVV